jgi:adenosine deaminase
MELKNMKQEEIKRMEVYYERIKKLAHGLQVSTIDNFLITMFRAGLQPYFKIATTRMKRSTLQ